MPWNWQLPTWPKFSYDTAPLIPLERQFLYRAGTIFGALKHFDAQERQNFIIEMLSAEGVNSSKIEGEFLERDSLQASLRRHFDLETNIRTKPREQSMADLLCEVYASYQEPLTSEMVCEWHRLLMVHQMGLSDLGRYRTHEEPMQIVSGRYGDQKVYFEAPPSKNLPKEMAAYIEWYNHVEVDCWLVKAAHAHVYFESIHPFEDGNGRIGRALVEKILSQALGHPTLLAISKVIEKRKREYYQALGECNRTLEIQSWVHFFANVILDAQNNASELLNFLLFKFRLLHRLAGTINARQEKVLKRMFEEGIEGFAGGLSAENYLKITKTSPATATRDLQDLVDKGALYITGKLRYTRYWLPFSKKIEGGNLTTPPLS